MHKRNVKFNAVQSGRQLVKERLLLLQWLRAWLVQQDDDHSETADTGMCADHLECGRLVHSVDQRQHDIGTGNNADAAVVDQQVVSCMWSCMIDDVVSGAA